MEQEHTPIPWHVRTLGGIGSFIEAKPSSAPYGQEILCDDDYSSKAGDMEFIVKAVNNHGYLLAALKLVVEHHQWRSSIEGPSSTWGDKVIPQAKAAIAQVEGSA